MSSTWFASFSDDERAATGAGHSCYLLEHLAISVFSVANPVDQHKP
jgi:hypothetical protein